MQESPDSNLWKWAPTPVRNYNSSLKIREEWRYTILTSVHIDICRWNLESCLRLTSLLWAQLMQFLSKLKFKNQCFTSLKYLSDNVIMLIADNIGESLDMAFQCNSAVIWNGFPFLECVVMGINVISGFRTTEVHHHLLAVWPWANILPYLSISFLTELIAAASQGCWGLNGPCLCNTHSTMPGT